MVETGDRYFLRNVPLREALDRWAADRREHGAPVRLDAVTVALGDALGLVTAAPVWARQSSPPFDAAAMDGIAVRAADTVGASESRPLHLDAGAYVVVDTGDPLPDNFDAVVMREHVHFDGDRAEVRAAVAQYAHVRLLGEDITRTELLLPEGHRLRAVDLAAVAASGATEVVVRRCPLVAVVPTGDELRPVGAATGPGEILDTNSLMLAGQLREAGCDVTVAGIVADDPAAIAAAVRAAAAAADLVLLVAGSSAGRDDHSAPVVAQLGVLSAHGIAVKPGHPVVLGVVDATPVIGVPGYPVSAAMTFDLIARPLLDDLVGAARTARPVVHARLARKLASTIGMDDWIRVRLGRVGSQLVAAPLSRAAGVLTSLVRADGLVCVPAAVEGHQAGETVAVELLRDLGAVERTVVAVGSHDLVLDLAASQLRARDPGVTLASSNVGSLGGLVALRDGLCHIAGSHLLDPATGEYTLPFVDRVLSGVDVVVVRLVHRRQGLLVAPGNPLGIEGVADLRRADVRYANRQRGSGTRVLLDVELAAAGIAPDAVQGYAREEHTHVGVAAAVAGGRADTGLAVLAAARAFDLDFVPVAAEPYDLVVRADAVDDPVLAPLWGLLGDDGFRTAVEALGGYDTAEMGHRIRG